MLRGGGRGGVNFGSQQLRREEETLTLCASKCENNSDTKLTVESEKLQLAEGRGARFLWNLVQGLQGETT